MQDGKIVEMGPSEEIYRHPTVDYTRKLIAAIPRDDLDHIRRRQADRRAASRG
jgi:ABC-type oligopeptide transport system ATPase subunit